MDGKSPDAFRGQNVRLGSFPKDGFKERVATAIAQIDQSCCRWHLLEGLCHVGTMPTRTYGRERNGMDPPTVHVTLDRSRWWCERKPSSTAGGSTMAQVTTLGVD